MKYIGKGLVFVLSIMILFSLCLTPVVFATEGENLPVPDRAATPSEATPPKDSGTAPPPASPPNATRQPEQSQEPELPDNETPPPEQQADTAATADELLDWLKNSSAGTLMLTADITLADAQVLRSFGERVTVDAGNYSITITGEVQLLCENLTITGTGDADGLLRVQSGGLLELGYLNVTAAVGGTALSQAEGAGLLIGGECTIAGDVRYAQKPFVWYWNESPLVVVSAAQTAQLPETVSAQINVQGIIERRDVPVLWALDEHEQAQAQRRRFYAKGSADGYMMTALPVCTVAYDDFPLTFTKVTAKEQSWCYVVTGGFTKPEAALPITVAEEYSFNGADWTTYYECTIENQYDGFSIELQKDEGEEHRWDTAASPQLYIRLRWMDGETAYYSNVLRFAAADFGTAEDIGGNRGGGTDITDPPTVPTPDPTPTPDPPTTTGNGGSNGGGSITPEPTPTPTPTSDPAPPAETNPPAAIDPIAGSSAGATKANTVPSTSTLKPEKPAEVMPEPEPKPVPVSTPEPPAATATPTPSESVEAHAAPEPTPKWPGALPIAVGCLAVAGTIGAAGLYLHPQVLKRLLELVRNILPKK